MSPRLTLLVLFLPCWLHNQQGRKTAVSMRSWQADPGASLRSAALSERRLTTGRHCSYREESEALWPVNAKALEFWPNHPEAYPLHKELSSRASLREDTKPVQDSIPPVAPETLPAKETKQDRPPGRTPPPDVTRRHASAKPPIVNSPVVQGPGFPRVITNKAAFQSGSPTPPGSGRESLAFCSVSHFSWPIWRGPGARPQTRRPTPSRRPVHGNQSRASTMQSSRPPPNTEGHKCLHSGAG